MPGSYSICAFCGRKSEIPSEGPPCVMLEGWLTVLHWRGLSAVEQHDFCCITCLCNWAKVQTTKVPQVFLESFDENPEGESDPQ